MSSTIAKVGHGASGDVVKQPATCIKESGVFHVEHFDSEGNLKGTYDLENGSTTLGLNKMLDVMFHGGAPIATWYCGLVDNASFSAYAIGDTMAQIAGTNGWRENTGYSDSTRIEWIEGAAAAGVMTNASQMLFNMNATNTIKGLFIVGHTSSGAEVKGGTTGILWATASYTGGTIPVVNGDILRVTYTCTLS